MPFAVPERIETARLVLRMLLEADWQALHEYYSDAICTRYTVGRALSEGDSWRTLATMVGHWHLRGYGPYAIESRASGELLGISGLWYPADFPEREIKWGLVRRHWGQGYASEAARAVLGMARQVYPAQPPISFIDARNDASIHVALALGASLERETGFRGAAYRIYRHRAA
jgi:RimJ/RimL family protein N-acetyltransferase